jgi:hypothetical protein
MTRRRQKPDDDALFALPAGRRGRVESAVNKSVRRAWQDEALNELDAGLVTLARAQGRAVDVAEAARDVWALSRASGELRETLIRLRLDPTSRGASGDSLASFLAELAKPSPADPAGAAPVGDPPQSPPPDVRPGGLPPDAGAGPAADAVATPGRRRRPGGRTVDG